MRFESHVFSHATTARSSRNLRHVLLAGSTLALVIAGSPAEAQLLRTSTDTATTNGVLGTGVTVTSTSPGSSILGTGVAVNTTSTSGGIVGTGLTVGTTNPGDGVLGTGVTLGTTNTATGVLGTGIVVGSTNPGDGVLGTGVTLGSPTSGTPGTPTPGTPAPGTPTPGTPNPGTPTSGSPTPTSGTPGSGGPLATDTLVIRTGTGGPLNVPASSASSSGDETSSISLRLSKLEQKMSSPTNDFPLRGNDTSSRGAPVANGTNSVAAGYGASAGGENASAYGTGASAGASGSIAIGNSSSAEHANAVAIGTNAKTTRANQVAVGTTSSTYTMAGLGSAASRAAQSGSTQFVTTDAAGNLATTGYGPSSIAALDGRVGTLEANVGRLQHDMRAAYQGTAIALALTGAVLPEGKTFALSANLGAYHGEAGFGASGIARINDNVFVSGGIGVSTTGQTNVAGRGGVTLAW